MKHSQTGSDKNKFITGLKFVSININSIRGKKLELLAFLDFHQPQIVAFKRQKLTAPYLPQNRFRNLVHIMCSEKIEPKMVAVLCYLSTSIFCICQS